MMMRPAIVNGKIVGWSDGTLACGTSEGVRKAWEKRRRGKAGGSVAQALGDARKTIGPRNMENARAIASREVRLTRKKKLGNVEARYAGRMIAARMVANALAVRKIRRSDARFA